MIRQRLSLQLISLGLILILEACNSAPAAPTSAPTSVPPTATSIPPTSTPTFTPEPTITPTFTPTPSMGSTMVSERDEMVLVFVPTGEFTMGSKLYADERPAHQVDLNAYWIDKTEVTNNMYVRFLNDIVSQISIDPGDFVRFNNNIIYGLICPSCNSNKWTDRINWNGTKFSVVSGYENHPVVFVTWYGADSYCAWANQRLPTEAEWEKAARGPDARTYPWGDIAPNGNLSNFGNSVGNSTEVGKYPKGASIYGALDMAGNVEEWVKDWFDEKYYQSSPDSNPLGPDSGQERVTRGNGWGSIFPDVRAAYRWSYKPATVGVALGFRCARSQ